jgi:hypothetical protein
MTAKLATFEISVSLPVPKHCGEWRPQRQFDILAPWQYALMHTGNDRNATMRTTLRINDQLLAEAKKLAIDTDRTLTQVVEDSLRELLARSQKNGHRKRITLPTSGGTGLQPGVDLSSNQSMYDAMDEPDAYSGR